MTTGRCYQISCFYSYGRGRYYTVRLNFFCSTQCRKYGWCSCFHHIKISFFYCRVISDRSNISYTNFFSLESHFYWNFFLHVQDCLHSLLKIHIFVVNVIIGPHPPIIFFVVASKWSIVIGWPHVTVIIFNIAVVKYLMGIMFSLPLIKFCKVKFFTPGYKVFEIIFWYFRFLTCLAPSKIFL